MILSTVQDLNGKLELIEGLEPPRFVFSVTADSGEATPVPR